MRQSTLHIPLALLTFTAGVLCVSAVTHLIIALPIALGVLLLLKQTTKIKGIRLTRHHLQVAGLTLALWAIVVYVFLSVFLPPFTSCVVELSAEEAQALSRVGDEQQVVAASTPKGTNISGVSECACDEANADAVSVNSVWVGVVNEKAISKPVPRYSSALRSTGIKSTVVVLVLIDEAGDVVRAQAVSGYPLLRQAAQEAACEARFSPVLVCGPQVRISGVLTYDFRLK